jgi:predicted CoA-binding protein
MTDHENPSRDELRKLLTDSTNIALVGASSDRSRPSHGIMKKLLAAGYRVVPVNPNEAEVLGQKAYGSLAEVPGPIDIVNVFRRPEHTPPLADEAAQAGAKALWLQSGIWNDETAARARSHGLVTIMDECIGVVHSLLGVPRKPAPGA